MKVRIYSDLHLEFAKFKIPVLEHEDKTILILAGDIGVGLEHRYWVEQLCKRFFAIIYVLGNHEFYGKEYEDIKRRWKIVSYEVGNLFVLDNEIATINGTKFLGTTLWTEIDPVEQINASMFMTDYRVIKVGKDILTPYHTITWHREAVDFLHREIEPGCIIVSHHAPHVLSTKKFTDRNGSYGINSAYYTDLTDLIQHDVSLFIHGHTHDNNDYMIGNCRVVSNPRGYFQYNKSENKSFIETGLVV